MIYVQTFTELLTILFDILKNTTIKHETCSSDSENEVVSHEKHDAMEDIFNLQDIHSSTEAEIILNEDCSSSDS